jgi:hypothetical protein
MPMLEMACGRVEHLNEFQNLYNIDTGFNDDYIHLDLQRKIDKDVRAQRKYQCHKPFD